MDDVSAPVNPVRKPDDVLIEQALRYVADSRIMDLYYWFEDGSSMADVEAFRDQCSALADERDPNRLPLSVLPGDPTP